MLRRILLLVPLAAAGLTFALASGGIQTVLPAGWRLSPPAGALAVVGTMPQGIAISPDGRTLAVVESGVNPAALRFLDAKTLRTIKLVALKGAYGKPVWLDGDSVLVAGAATDSVTTVHLSTGTVAQVALSKGAWPVQLAFSRGGPGAVCAVVSNDFNDPAKGSISFGCSDKTTPDLEWNGPATKALQIGAHPAAAVWLKDTIYTALRGQSSIAVVESLGGKVVRRIAVGSHPCDLALSADSRLLYVAVCDNDSVAVIDTRTNARIANIPVGFHTARVHGYGANPNALLVAGSSIFVSLGGENAVAVIRNNRVAGYIPAGWYPTGLAIGRDGTLYVSNGKGESAPANPQFRPEVRDGPGYVGSITVGSVRAIPKAAYVKANLMTAQALSDLMPLWQIPASTVVRAGGPIKHVIYVIKENRSYDQVLGDIKGANGDPSLVAFGRENTPNQHAIAERFGVFDNAYANAQVSADGHNWTDAATANDYVERMWPVSYGGRRAGYDSQNGVGADVPHSGYLWDAAKRAHVTYRDYGEDMTLAPGPPLSTTDHPALHGHYDPASVGWNLKYSDLDRLKEWKREFDVYVRNKQLPQLEFLYLPNDHTAGAQAGAPTPQAYVATNDWAVGQLVDAVSHSPYWNSTAIFILEDDAQNGPDHVSDQRSTFYIASPYARGGVDHSHYSTVSFVRTIEVLLGLAPLSVADATAQPLYNAFAAKRTNAKPFDALKPSIDMNAKNQKSAYGSAVSARLDFSKPDTADPRILNDILRHAVRKR